MAVPPIEKKKIPPKPQPPQKKKKKNAPDKPQPAWLFPPDDENPVLNPKSKSTEELIREKQERNSALEYMKRRVHAVPDRPAPPPELLTLVGIFLTDFGFNSTSRLFTNERKARTTLNGWEDGAIDRKVEKGTPTLEHIYREWYREWKVKTKDETSSSESESESDESDSESEAGVTTQVRGLQSSDDDSEASSDGLGGSDLESRKAPTPKFKKSKATKKSSISSSSASSSSDSDADDEDEKKITAKSASTSKKAKSQPKTISAKPTAGALISSLKRKAPPSHSSDSKSSSKSSEDGRPALAKKAKTSTSTDTAVANLPNGTIESASSSSSDFEDESRIDQVDTAKAKVESESDSKSSESSASDSSSEDEVKENKKSDHINNSLPTVATAASDSSVTMNGEVKKPITSTSESDSSSEDSSSESDNAPAQEVVPKKKHHGAKLTPLAELSAKGVDNQVSNQYQSYEYADRAYKDLSVTRGKGFTKEKNKKKRGSYRGGAIDTSGGKGFKFED